MLGSAIYDLVMQKMEEYSPFGVNSSDDGILLGSGDELSEVKPVGSYVREHLPLSCNEILKVCPLHLLHYLTWGCRAVADVNDDAIGSIALPLDFLRLHTLRMSSWSRDLHEVYRIGTPAYELQQNRWTRGSWSKPAATLSGNGRTYDVISRDDYVRVQNKQYLDLSIAQERVRVLGTNGIVLPKELVYQVEADGSVVRLRDMDIFWDENAHRTEWRYNRDNLEPARLRYYSIKRGSPHEVECFNYIGIFSESTDYADSVAELIALNCARKVYEIYGNTEMTGIMAGEIDSILSKL